MKFLCACLLVGALLSATAWSAPPPTAPVQAAPVQAAPNARLVLPNFSTLAQKASQTVNITLDTSMLAMASRFLDSDDPQDAATLDVIKGLRGIYVKSYTFDQDGVYEQSDIDAVLHQLTLPGWTPLVETMNRKTRANVHIYIMIADKTAIGMAVIASEPRQFTLVNIIGSIDLAKLHKLQGHFGVPNLDSDKPAK